MTSKNKPIRYRNCELLLTRDEKGYNLGMKFSNPDSINNPHTVDTKLSEDVTLQFYEHITSVLRGRADELRKLSGRYDQLLGLAKKVEGGK